MEWLKPLLDQSGHPHITQMWKDFDLTITFILFLLFRIKLFIYFSCLSFVTVKKSVILYLNFDMRAILPLACSKIWPPERRRVEALDWRCDRQEDWRKLHGQPEEWSSFMRVSCGFMNLWYHCIRHLKTGHFMSFLFIYRLINVLQPGSVTKINNPSQNWHQVP